MANNAGTDAATWPLRNNTKKDIFVKYGQTSPRVFEREDELKTQNLQLNQNFLNAFPHYHHGILPFNSQIWRDVSRVPPGVGIARDGALLPGEFSSDIPTWNESTHPELATSFFDTLSERVNSSDASFILFSGGIDSLLLAMLDKKDRPLVTADLDPVQTQIASHFARLLGKTHSVETPNSHPAERAECIDFLRRHSLGHYLEWNSGLVGFKEFHNKKFISGQHADTLLMVDTFVPGIHLHGPYRFAAALMSVPNRLAVTPLSKLSNAQELFNKDFNRRVASYDEHTSIWSSSGAGVSRLHNSLLDRLGQKVVASHDERLRLLKEIKYYQFIVNANYTYQVHETHFGIARDLVYFDRKVRNHLLSYVPTIRDAFVPKSLFYNFVRKNGFDYFSEKKHICKSYIDTKYFIRRLKVRKKTQNYEFALACLMRNAGQLGLDSEESLSRHLEKKGLSLTLTKRNLMKIDRYLNLQLFIDT